MIFLSGKSFKPALRTLLKNTVVTSGLIAGLMGTAAFADDTTEISRLMRAGQYPEALIKVDAALAKTPKDAQTRFLKGVILTEQNKTQEAITLFSRLTEDFPELPEPYNNLAVLYASSAQYDKARSALEMAIRTNPTYATAYENLGDVHARLASQAYDKALQLDSANNAAKSKLTLVRSLVGNATGGTNPKTGVVAANASARAAPAPMVAMVAPKAEPAKPEAVAPVAKQETVKPAPAAKSEPAKPIANASMEEQDDVLEAVNAWAKAWSARDIKSYLNYYSSDFQPAKGESRKAWAEERTARIVGKGSINVGIQSPKVALAGNTATVKFRQTYVSGSLKSDTRKTLVLNKQAGKWQIKQERTGN